MKMVLFFVFLLTSYSALAKGYSFKCSDQKEGVFQFHISIERKVIVFSNINYFGGANILKDTPFGISIEDQSKKFNFSYEWYYTAEFQINFIDQSIYNYKKGDIAKAAISFDDGDGSSIDKDELLCMRVK